VAAVGEGAAIGAGGFLVGLADFPVLLGIKMKFLLNCATLYGCDVNDSDERLYILYVFQLAFSNREHRLDCFLILSLISKVTFTLLDIL
jgi:hypothetical protein